MTPEQLRELFYWNAESGEIFWRERYGRRQAFVSVQTQGYLYGKVKGKNYLAHRVLWALENGKWPDGEIDHINQNKKDNRISNLHVVSHTENNRNKGVYKNNTSGTPGVCRTKAGKWRSYITVHKKQIHVGVFDCLEKAKAARSKACQEYMFSKNHGKMVAQD